jgi:tetratricopeptide (TPR) repeat protein
MMRLLIALLLLPAFGWAQQSCHDLRKRGQEEEARACYRNLLRSDSLLAQAEGYWGLGRLQDANETFRRAYSRNPKNAPLLVRWGLLLLEGSNPADAARTLEEAIEVQPDYAPALLALARVGARSFSRQAQVFAEKALEKDAKLLEARELLAVLALEEGDRESATRHANTALSQDSEALEALTVLETIDLLDGKEPSAWSSRIAAVNPRCAECAARRARLFVLNRRYIEGIREYIQAVAIRPDFWAARSELGINLMRVGRDAEARRELEQAYNNGFRNDATVNSLRLLDSYKNFEVFPNPRFVLRLHKKEAALLKPYVEREMVRNLDEFEKRYGVKLPGPVTVEMYPDHEDFAVRTMGMPGLGALGVTFVLSVAMDSPSARKTGTFHWASTLRHELSHVFSLAATDHRIPRWFTEGIAVFEETSANKEWGDRVTPDILQALKESKLLPIARLDRGFIRPSYPSQVVVSYFQAGAICEYIHEKWGWAKLTAMMKDFRDLASTPEVVRDQLGMNSEAFDKEFLAWLDSKYGASVRAFDEWTKGMKSMEAALKAERWEEAARLARRQIELYPDYIEERNAYTALAAAELSLKNRAAAIQALESYARRGGKDPVELKRLAELHQVDGNSAAAIAALSRINFIQPTGDPELHAKLAQLYEKQLDWSNAAVEYGAVAAAQPVDPAAAHFNLARVLYAGGRLDDARDQVLLALEAAPGYRAAQKLLLQLEAQAGKKDE